MSICVVEIDCLTKTLQETDKHQNLRYKMKFPSMWIIRAGKNDIAKDIFLTKNRIAIGWPKMGDLSQLKPNRDSFKQSLSEAYPETKVGAIPNTAGQLYRFVHKMIIGDLIVFPPITEQMVHIGLILGDYLYSPDVSLDFPNQRKVFWLKTVPKNMFSQAALSAIKPPRTLFKVINHSNEFIVVLEEEPMSAQTKRDGTLTSIVDNIKQITNNFVRKTLVEELKGCSFIEFIAHVLEKLGYHVLLPQTGQDQEIDIVAQKVELGFESPIIKVRTKSGDSKIDLSEVSQLFRNIGEKESGLFVTLGDYTEEALQFAALKTNLRLMKGSELINLIMSYYEELESRYKEILPLRKVYFPDALADQEDQLWKKPTG